MEKVCLVQRLRKLLGDAPLACLANPFAFGGGLKNGGLSNEAMKLLNGIFLFDYMGSAEFEWGAVPKALSRIYDDKLKRAFNITVKTKDNKSGIVYIICGTSISKEVVDWITYKAYDEYDKNYTTKEYVGLQDVINGEGWKRICGWLELDNGFFFFTDQDMFEKTKKLFGL